MMDLNGLLQQYYDIVQQLKSLEERKNELREQIRSAVQQQGCFAATTIGETTVNASVRTSVKVDYDEAGLRKRLGDRFHLILAPDPRKVGKHLAELRPALEPFLDTIGSVSPELVAQQIGEGALTIHDFAGLFKKEQKSTLIVKMVPAAQQPGPTTNNK